MNYRSFTQSLLTAMIFVVIAFAVAGCNDRSADAATTQNQNPGGSDLCMDLPGVQQKDSDGDGVGDACDSDTSDDLCPDIPGTQQTDSDGDGIGDACDSDTSDDLCPDIPGTQQTDSDGDGIGDACEANPSCPGQPFTIKSIHPEDGAENVSVGTDIIVKFSRAPEKASIGTSLSSGLITLTSANGTQVDLTYRVNGSTAYFTPTSALSDDTTYTFVIKASTNSGATPSAIQAANCADSSNPQYLTLTDDQGDPVDEIDVIFTTGMFNDLEIVKTDPVDGTNAGTDVKPQVTFNQKVKDLPYCSGGASAAIRLVDLNGTPSDTSDDQQVQGVCDVNGNTVTFDPYGIQAGKVLELDEDYRVILKADGVQPSNPHAAPLQQKETIDFHTVQILSDCSTNVAGICLIDKSSGGGLVNDLLNEETGPLAPIASYIGGKDKLVDGLNTLLSSKNPTLASHLKALFVEGHLQEGLKQLLISDKGLRTILPELLTGLPELLKNGVGGLLEALATGTDTSACDAALGTVCLVGSDSPDGKTGVLDLLIGDAGYLNSIGLSQQQLVDILGDTLASGDGSLRGLVQGLFQQGHLKEGLQALLIGNKATGGQPGLLVALQDISANLVPGVLKTVGRLLGVDESKLSGLDNIGELLGQIPGLGKLLEGLGDLVDEIPVLGPILGPLLP